MRIGLIDVDAIPPKKPKKSPKKPKKKFPNLPLMKLSAWHRAQGDTVEWHNPLTHYDRVYLSRVFDDTYRRDYEYPIDANEIIRGGTGYDLHNTLPVAVEHMMPDYELYGIKNTAYGFLTRGCPFACEFCCVSEKEGRKSVKVADLSEWWSGQRNIILMDANLTACPDGLDLLRQLANSKASVDFTQGLSARCLTVEVIEALNAVKTKMIHFAWDLMEHSDEVIRGLELYAKHGKVQDFRKRRVYVLTNYNTTMAENLHRVYTLLDMGYDPYVMVYDKPNAPREIRRFQRWCNAKEIFRKVPRWEDYD